MIVELRRFIAQSLVEIIQGIEDAQRELDGKSHGRICPALSSAITAGGNEAIIGLSTEKRPIALVEYDVAVKVESGSVSGTLGVSLGVVNIGGTKGKRDHEHAARLKFSVPISYPEIAKLPGQG